MNDFNSSFKIGFSGTTVQPPENKKIYENSSLSSPVANFNLTKSSVVIVGTGTHIVTEEERKVDEQTLNEALKTSQGLFFAKNG